MRPFGRNRAGLPAFPAFYLPPFAGRRPAAGKGTFFLAKFPGSLPLTTQLQTIQAMKKVLLFALLLYLAACSSGKQALQRGNYEESVLKAVNRLRSNPDHKKARATLQEAFPLTVSYHQEKIAALKSSTEPFRWEKILDSYNTLTMLHEEIQRCPACRHWPRVPRSYLNEAAEARFQAAPNGTWPVNKAFKRDHSRLSAKEAFLHYRRANELQPDYRDVRAKMDEAYYYATLKVVLEQIPVHSRTLGLSHEFFRTKSTNSPPAHA
jgi:hypothetical protein